MQPSEPTPQYILFLDGDCVFCQRSAQLIHRLDKHSRIFFAPLQGKTAQQLPKNWTQLSDADGKASGAAVMVENLGAPDAISWRGADAPLRALKIAGGIWSILWILHFTPCSIKSLIYGVIARNRHRLTSRHPSCAMPTEAFRKHMLP